LIVSAIGRGAFSRALPLRHRVPVIGISRTGIARGNGLANDEPDQITGGPAFAFSPSEDLTAFGLRQRDVKIGSSFLGHGMIRACLEDLGDGRLTVSDFARRSQACLHRKPLICLENNI
jgi:hypothetical protein